MPASSTRCGFPLKHDIQRAASARNPPRTADGVARCQGCGVERTVYERLRYRFPLCAHCQDLLLVGEQPVRFLWNLLEDGDFEEDDFD